MQKTCGRLSPAVRLYAANFTVRVITMCQRDTSDHDGQPKKTRRGARGLVGRRHLVPRRTASLWMPERGSAWLACWAVRARPPRGRNHSVSTLGSKHFSTSTHSTRKLQRLRAQRYEIHYQD